MHNLKTGLLICVAALLSAAEVYAADFMLSGVITARNGQKLEGVTVSAKLEGATITTSVYTDSGGSYVFPPLAAGRYRVWAQALGFETAKSPVVLASAQRSNFTLDEIRNAERRFRQLPGEMMVAALPEATPEDAHMKKIFMNNCTGCHATSYALQFRFDEAGWSKIIDLMKVVPVNGVYPGPNAKPSQILERNQKPLAAYLARARGPGASSMKVVSRPRPAGEAARAVWTLYDLQLNPDAGIGTQYVANDGTDWTMGTTSKLGQLAHDGGLGLDGTVYFTVNNPNRMVTTTLLVRRGRSLSPARGDHQSPRTISVQHRRMGIAAGSFACHLDITTRQRGFLDALATNQTHRDTALRCTLASGRMDAPIKDKAPRIHSVATPLLGTPDPRRCRFRAPHGLPALQPGQT